MKKLAGGIKAFLSSPMGTIGILMLAVTGRMIQLVYYFNIRVDMSFQIMATRNLVQGHGISSAYISPSDLSTVVYHPLINWPPGYSLLFLPFYLLFGQNYMAAGMTISLLAALALIFYSRGILRVLKVPLYLVNLYTLLTCFFIYFFYFIASSDAVTISFFIAGFYYALLLLKTYTHRKRNTILFTLMMLACALMKYLFIPVVFILPLFFLVIGFIHQRRDWKVAGISSIFALVVGVSLLFLYHKSAGGSSVYISEPGRGFYPEALLWAYPVFPASFLKPDSLELFFPINPGILYKVYQVIYLVFLVFSTAYVFYSLRGKNFRELSLNRWFLYLSWLLILCVAGVLAALSLVVAPEGGIWSYISEPRYHGLPNVLLHLSLFLLLAYAGLSGLKKYRSILFLFLFLLLIEFSRGLYFTFNRAVHFKREEYSWQFEDRFQKFAASLMEKERTLYPNARTVLAGPVYFLNHRISLYTNTPIFDEVEKLNNWQNISTKEPVLLMVIIPDEEAEKFQTFMQQHKNEVKGRLGRFSFYSIYVQP